MKFSIIIPVYNRPKEISELLHSLLKQTYTDFEVLVIEDGSTLDASREVQAVQKQLDVNYYYIPNGGQGFARNYGFKRALGDYFIVFDSDCIIPTNYLQQVAEAISVHQWDAFGGPDAAHPSFNALQKAISYTMTSPFTTGGIRGQKKHVGVFYPRSFNMGISRKVWEETGGFRWTNQSEDMEFSRRMHEFGYKVGLIAEAKVYHKRRTNLKQFFKQIKGFGAGRIRLYRSFPDQLSWFHFFPVAFIVGNVLLLNFGLNLLINPTDGFKFYVFWIGFIFWILWIFALFLHSWMKNRSFKVAFLSVVAGFVQLFAYGIGFLQAFGKR